MTQVAERLVTPEEFALLPEPREGGKLEYVRGRVIQMAPVGPDHGERAVDIGAELRAAVRAVRLGVVRVETGYWLSMDPPIYRAPDVSFVRRERLAGERLWHGGVAQGPDLAVEITSPSDTDREVAAKVEEYLANGVARVWVVRPELQTITVHRPGGEAHVYHVDEALTADDAAFGDVPFTLSLRAIFPD